MVDSSHYFILTAGQKVLAEYFISKTMSNFEETMIIYRSKNNPTWLKYFFMSVVLVHLSSCSLFEPAIQTCDEVQEYQSSYSIPDLTVPNALREIQQRSSFYIPETIEANAPISEEFLPILKEELEAENNPQDPISGDQLSELLDLIDSTIENRDNALAQQSYDQKSSVKPVKSSSGECLDVSPNYFADGVLKSDRPSQSSKRTNAESNDKGWWERMRERRNNRKEEGGS